MAAKKDDTGKANDETEKELVEPLKPQAFQTVMAIIDRADIKGSDASGIINLKAELIRVANIKTRP